MYTWDVGVERDGPRAFRVALLRMRGNGTWVAKAETRVGYFASPQIMDRAITRLCNEIHDPELTEDTIQTLQRWARFDATCERLGVHVEHVACIAALIAWRALLIASDATNAIGRLRKRLQLRSFSQRRMR